MKTLQELYDEIIASDELKKEFAESIKTKEDTAAFLKKQECSATVDELIEFIKEKMPENPQKMSEEELAAVAGGKSRTAEVVTTVTTIFGCIVLSAYENWTEPGYQVCFWQ